MKAAVLTVGSDVRVIAFVYICEWTWRTGDSK